MRNARISIPLFFTLLAAPLAFGASGALAGCGGGTGGEGGAGGGPACFDYTSFKSDSPAVTFSGNVLTIFRTSCGLSNSCHGNMNGTGAQHYFGPPLTDGAGKP